MLSPFLESVFLYLASFSSYSCFCVVPLCVFAYFRVARTLAPIIFRFLLRTRVARVDKYLLASAPPFLANFIGNVRSTVL